MQVVESTSGVWEWLAGVKSTPFPTKKQRDAKSGAQVATCPICSVSWKPLYQSKKRSSRRNKPYLYSNLLRRNPHCQAHKRFIELGKARSYRKLVRRYRDAIKQRTDKEKPKSGSHVSLMRVLRLFCITGSGADLVIEHVCTVIGVRHSHCYPAQAKVPQPSLLVLI